MTDLHELTLLAFLTALRKELQALSAEDVIERLIKYGETIPAEQRQIFLRHFSITQNTVGAGTVEGYVPDDTLAEDVDAFVNNVKSKSYVEGWDWDYHTDAMVVWGDESWADDMAYFFENIDTAFFAADFATAAAEYPKLLALFDLPSETGEGYFPGESDPLEMVGINIQETVARYLRSLLGNDGEWNIDTFTAELAKMSGRFARTFSIKSILEASPQPLHNTDQFFRELEPAVAARSQHAPGYGHPDWPKLLREVVALRGGTEGIGALAHEQGATMPETYYEWILALRREGQDEEALHAAREGVTAVQIPQARGVLANALATMLDERGKGEEALQAKQLAWRSYPTLYNLKVLLAHGHPDIPEMLRRIAAEYALVGRGEITFSQLAYSSSSMRILMQALAGDYDQLAREAHNARGLGWSPFDHTGYSFYTALLMALLDPPALPPAGSQLATLLQQLAGYVNTGGLETIMPTSPSALQVVDIPALLIAQLARHPELREHHAVYRDAARQLAFRRVEDIVGNQQRNAYGQAAQLAVALAEALQLSGHPTEAAAIPKELVARFPHHSAFRKELNSTWRASLVVRGMAL